MSDTPDMDLGELWRRAALAGQKPGRFRKKPVEIEAVQLTWKTWNLVCEFTGDTISEATPAWNIEQSEASDTCDEIGPFIAMYVTTTHGERAVVRHGDWIIPDSKPGTFYPCKPDVFRSTYEPLESRAVSPPVMQTCEACDGDGYDEHGSRNPEDDSFGRRCPYCKGTGEVKVYVADANRA